MKGRLGEEAGVGVMRERGWLQYQLRVAPGGPPHGGTYIYPPDPLLGITGPEVASRDARNRNEQLERWSCRDNT